MKTRTVTIVILWLILDAMLLHTDLEETLGETLDEALSLQEQEVGKGLVTASSLRGRSPP